MLLVHVGFPGNAAAREYLRWRGFLSWQELFRKRMLRVAAALDHRQPGIFGKGRVGGGESAHIEDGAAVGLDAAGVAAVGAESGGGWLWSVGRQPGHSSGRGEKI